ncbi:MAG TPA: DJ-1 family glyoxalase III [Victivallales bacterium]|nr:DJ-1 family glyoxalase III [Victivallales bacterium]
MKKDILLLLTEGFEEVEAVVPVDFLRRLGVNLITVGLENKTVTGSHNIVLQTDITLAEVIPDNIAALILPGGMPGSTNLRDNDKVINLIKVANSQNKLIAAICAASIALYRAGILQNKNHTAHPSVKEFFIKSNYTEKRVEQDDNIITAKGPGVSFEFALRIAQYLGFGDSAEKLFKEMFIVK